MADTNSNEWTVSPLLLKAGIIVLIAALLLLPARLIQQITSDREESWNDAVAEVSSKWADPQTVTGPVISVPFTEPQSQETPTATVNGYVHLLPEELHITGSVEPEMRHRGIYDVMLYRADLHLSGKFSVPDLQGVVSSNSHLHWDQSIISVGITDMRGINEAIEIELGENTIKAQPGVRQTDVVWSGVSTLTGLVSDTIGSFAFDLSLNGSQQLNFVPIGKTTKVNLRSPWSHPSFDGAFLPDDHTISSDGFDAHWTILDLNRNFPQAWVGKAFRLEDTWFGMKLFTPVDTYQKNWRATRYAALFIGLTFLIYFFAEARHGSKVHPVQYGLVGAVLCIFYVLLLSISEHLRFEIAYIVASAAVVLLLTIFTATAFGNWKQPLLVFSALAVLYGFLYSLLQLNDYALLIGSIGLFLMVSAFLLLSRRIKWYSGGKEREPQP